MHTSQTTHYFVLIIYVCFFEQDPPSKPETPIEYRSPELILDNRISTAQDCWAFACFIYSLLTNASLFELSFIYDKNSQNDAHILQLFSLLGPLPSWLKQSWPRHDVYFNNDGQLQKFVVEDDEFSSYPEFEDLPREDDSPRSPDDEDNHHQQKADEEVLPNGPRNRLGKPAEFFDPDLYPSIVTLRECTPHPKDQEVSADPTSLADFVALNPPLAKKWAREKHPDMQSAESELVLDLLQGLLTYEPDQRLSTKELLNHPWIQRYCAPDSHARLQDSFLEKAPPAQRSKRKRVDDEGLTGEYKKGK